MSLAYMYVEKCTFIWKDRYQLPYLGDRNIVAACCTISACMYPIAVPSQVFVRSVVGRAHNIELNTFNIDTSSSSD